MKSFLMYSYYKICSFYIRQGHKHEPEWLAMTLISVLLGLNLITMFILIKWVILKIFALTYHISLSIFCVPFAVTLYWSYINLFKKRVQIISFWKTHDKMTRYPKGAVTVYLVFTILIFFLLLLLLAMDNSFKL